MSSRSKLHTRGVNDTDLLTIIIIIIRTSTFNNFDHHSNDHLFCLFDIEDALSLSSWFYSTNFASFVDWLGCSFFLSLSIWTSAICRERGYISIRLSTNPFPYRGKHMRSLFPWIDNGSRNSRRVRYLSSFLPSILADDCERRQKRLIKENSLIFLLLARRLN